MPGATLGASCADQSAIAIERQAAGTGKVSEHLEHHMGDLPFNWKQLPIKPLHIQLAKWTRVGYHADAEFAFELTQNADLVPYTAEVWRVPGLVAVRTTTPVGNETEIANLDYDGTNFTDNDAEGVNWVEGLPLAAAKSRCIGSHDNTWQTEARMASYIKFLSHAEETGMKEAAGFNGAAAYKASRVAQEYVMVSPLLVHSPNAPFSRASAHATTPRYTVTLDTEAKLIQSANANVTAYLRGNDLDRDQDLINTASRELNKTLVAASGYRDLQADVYSLVISLDSDTRSEMRNDSSLVQWFEQYDVQKIDVPNTFAGRPTGTVVVPPTTLHVMKGRVNAMYAVVQRDVDVQNGNILNIDSAYNTTSRLYENPIQSIALNYGGNVTRMKLEGELPYKFATLMTGDHHATADRVAKVLLAPPHYMGSTGTVNDVTHAGGGSVAALLGTKTVDITLRPSVMDTDDNGQKAGTVSVYIIVRSINGLQYDGVGSLNRLSL